MDATCLTEGNKAYDTCSRCDYNTFEKVAKLDHVEGKGAEENRVEATCTAKGGFDTVVRCTLCNSVLSSEHTDIDMLEHNLSDVEAQTATCHQIGWDAYQYCLDCDYTTKVEIPMLEHVAADGVEENRVEATCEGKGGYDVVVYCSLCSDELSRQYQEIAALGHKPGMAVVENKVDATCAAAGSYDSVTYCTVCTAAIHREKTVIPQLAHDLVKVEARAAACEVVGYNDHKACRNCDYKEDYVEIPALEHVYSDWNVVKNAECGIVGERNRVCSLCSGIDTEEIPALEHVYGDWKVVTAATCTTDGLQERVCSLCTLEDEQVIPAAHTWVYVDYLVPTETTEGHTQYYECSVCLEKSGYQVLEKHAHEPADPVIEKYVASTCISSGSYDVVIYCSCSVCLYAEISRTTQTIATSGHTWIAYEYTAATCTEIGWDAYEQCLNCNAYKNDYYVEYAALGHDLVYEIQLNPTCTVDGLRYECCTRCDRSIEQVMPALRQHSFRNGVCTVCKAALYEALNYELNGDAYTVTGLNDETVTTVVIPDTYRGLPVTTLANNIFKNNKTIKEVYIGSNVTAIPTYAFYGCSLLETIHIGVGVIKMNGYAFTSTSALKHVYYDGTVDQWAQIVFGTSATAGTATASPFYAGYGKLYINGEVIGTATVNVDVNSYAFCKVGGITELILNCGVVNTYAFQYCYDLVHVSVGQNVTKINNYAFMYCYKKVIVTNNSGLNITIKDTTYSKNGGIAYNAKKIGGSYSVFIVGDFVFFDEDASDENSTIYLVSYKGNDSIVTLPETAQGKSYTVNGYAFYRVTNLRGIVVTGNDTVFLKNAVNTCSNFKYVFVADGVTGVMIDKTAAPLKTATELSYNAEGGDGNWYYGADGEIVFEHEHSYATEFVAPVGHKDGYERSVCVYCGKVGSEQAVYSVGHTFGDWSLYRKGTCQVLGIEMRTCSCGFREIKRIVGDHVADENGLCVDCGTTIYDALTYELNGEEYTVTGLANENTTIVFIPATYEGKPVTAMADSVFKNNTNIKEIYIGKNVKTISGSAFYGCSALETIHIGVGVSAIKASAFAATTALKHVYYDGTIDQYAQIAFGTSAASGTSTASPFYAGYGRLYIDGKVVNHAVIAAPEVSSYAFYHSTGIVTLDISSATINTYAFNMCLDLTQIILREGVTSIKNYAFMACYSKAEVINLSSLNITIKDTTASKNGGICYHAYQLLTAIPTESNVIVTDDGNVFYNNNGEYLFLSFIGEGACVLPEKINGNDYTVEGYAFYYNYFITSLTVPTTVTAFKASTFSGTKNLSAVYYGGTVDQWASMTFGSTTTSGTTTASPFYAGYGKLYIDGKVLGDVTINVDVSSCAFYKCGGINSVVINGTKVGTYAFQYCYDLVSVTIGKDVTSIGNYSFQYCYKKVEVINLSSLTITGSDTTYSKNGGIASNAKDLLTETPATSNFVREGDFIFYNNQGSWYLVSYVGDAEIVTLPKDVNGESYTVNAYAFYRCANLKAIIVTADKQAFENNAVNTCEALEYLYLAEGVTSVTIGATNTNLKAAKQVAYSETEKADAWHYVDGVPAIWETKA